MIRDIQHACGCVERNDDLVGRSITMCAEQKPLSFSRAQSLETTQPLPPFDGSMVAPEGYGERSLLACVADLIFGGAVAQLSIPVTQPCDFTPSQLRAISLLVQAERIRLLNERRTYVFARKGIPHRFEDMISQIDTQLDEVNRIFDKLKGHVS